MKETAIRTAETFGGTAKITMISEVPPLICNPEFTEQIVGFMKELDIPKLTPYPGISASASEDFANIAEQVPSAFMYLSAGYMDDLHITQRYSLMRMCVRSGLRVWRTVRPVI